MHFLNSSVLVPLDNPDLSVSIATITLKKQFLWELLDLKELQTYKKLYD